MPLNRRTLCSSLLAAAPLLAAPLPSLADTWPAKPLRWIVAYPAGGGSDFLARQLAPQLEKQLGQTIVIENRPGAGGIIGTAIAAEAAGDGYTLVTGDNGAMVFNTALYKKLPYDPKDFEPVGFMAGFPLILVTSNNSGFTSGRQLLDALKANPGKYSYASPGVGSPHHLAMELLKERTRSFVVHVPYRGTAMATQDVITGEVPISVFDTAAGLPLIRGGKLRALAVMSARRIPSLPDVPTLAELGVKDVDVTAWLALFVPQGTPADIRQRLGAEMTRAITTPEVKARLENFGLQVAPSDAAQLTRFLERERAFWHALIRQRGITAGQ